ncbi:transcriptional regulator, TetR family [Filimonas lacunae]|nr:transcriptional regulator, TetR family [Filimonas lacunae]
MSATNAIKEDLMQQQILQAAQQLFQKHGYQKVTMDDVAKAIGKGRSSLYYYYKNKDEVFDAVMDAEISDIMAELARAVEQATTVEQKLRTYGVTKTKISRKKKSFFDALETGMHPDEMPQYAQKKVAIQKKIRKEEAALLSKVLKQGTAQGEVATLDAKEQDMILFVFASTLRGFKREMMVDSSLARIEQAIDVLVQMTMLRLR